MVLKKIRCFAMKTFSDLRDHITAPNLSQKKRFYAAMKMIPAMGSGQH
jgi:hypothetical protein